MIKRFLFAAALLSLALASGCATGGNGPCATNCASVTVKDSDQVVVGLTLSIPLTATVSNSTQTAVNWSIQPTSCGSACGTLTNVTTSSATYVAPSAVPSNPGISIVATLQSDSSVSGSLSLTIIPVTADVAPTVENVGVGLTQQYTAVAVPDEAPQQFTWSCAANGVQCVNFTQDSNVSGLAYYKPTASEECGNGCVQISAVPKVAPTGCTVNPKTYPCAIGKTTAVASRVSGAYAFRFSGFDNNGKQILVAGTFTVGVGGAISGYEDEITSSGLVKYTISGGSYTPTASDPNNSNNAGTLILPTGVFPNHYQVVLDGAGDIQMIASDGAGNNGSGIAEPSSKNKFSQGSNQAFVFGFTGVDSAGNRTGYAGLMPTDGNGNISGGLMDVNDNGSTSNICGSSPCNVAGTYSADATASGLWHLKLTSDVTMDFDFFIANGNTNANSPLTIYAISRPDLDPTLPAVLGTIVFQNPGTTQPVTYNNAAFNGASISALTGANGNVSLTFGNTDGTADSSGNGNFTGGFDQNNNGTMVSVSYSPGFAYKYAAVPTGGPYLGRYTFQMLEVPNSNPVAPVTFILYASGANRGFLLDQSSSAVMTGTMSPQSNNASGTFANSAMTGTYAVATNSCSPVSSNACSVSSLMPVTMNLLLTSPGNSVFNVTGTQYPGTAGNVTGTYGIQLSGTGTVGLTAPATEHYIIYAVDQTEFFMIRDASKDTGVPSPILFATE